MPNPALTSWKLLFFLFWWLFPNCATVSCVVLLRPRQWRAW
jgi:hypothetical protein